eukprot:Selendium_serpulae@DN4699_c0_g1_i2.p1
MCADTVSLIGIPFEQLAQYALYTGLLGALALPYVKPSWRCWVSTCQGFLCFAIFSGTDMWKTLMYMAVCYPLSRIKSLGKWRAVLAFVFSFGWTTFLRLPYLPNWLTLNTGADLLSLIAILRVVSFVFDVADAELGGSSKNEEKFQPKGFVDFIHYVMFAPGIWAGPFLSYSAVHRCLKSESTADVRVVRFAVARLFTCLFHILVFAGLQRLFPFLHREFLTGPEFYEVGFLWRLAYLTLFMCQRRGRYMAAWMLSEITCVAAGIGHEEWKMCNATQSATMSMTSDKTQSRGSDRTGTVSGSSLWSSISYIGSTTWNSECLIEDTIVTTFRPMSVEFALSMQEVIRNWNCTVQTWLVKYTYTRLPSTISKTIRRFIVVAVSALWHGPNPAYLFSFVLIPTLQLSQDKMYKGMPDSYSVAGFNLMVGFKIFLNNMLLNF